MGFFDDIVKPIAVGAGALANPAVGTGLLAGAGMKAAAGGLQGGMDRQIPDLDPYTKALMGEQSGRANRDVGQFQDEAMSGVDQSHQLKAAQEESGEHSKALGGDTALLGSALTTRSKKNYDQGLSQMNRQAALNAPIERAKARATEAGLANEYYQIQAGAYNRQNEAYNNMVAARGSIINSVLGGVGSFAGMAAGGAKGKSSPSEFTPGESTGMGNPRGNFGSA